MLFLNCFNIVCKDARANDLQDELWKHLFLEEEDGLKELEGLMYKHKKA